MGYNRPTTYTGRAGLYATDPADSTTYLIGDTYHALTTTGLYNKIPVPRNGFVRACAVYWNNSTQDCTAEDVSFYVRKNNTTDSAVVYTGTFANATGKCSSTSLNLSVSAGDYLHLKFVTPAWVTNPTGVFLTCIILIESP